MTYTINTLAKMSGVSIRTLRFYDEIDLLKPAYVGENGYRYYQEEQLLILQQILFYKELELDLKQIKNILNRSDFNKTKALLEHKIVLEKKIQKARELIKTIDKTTNHLEGTHTMSMKELYDGFQQAKLESYKKYIRENNIEPESLKKSFEDCLTLTPEDYKNMEIEYNTIFNALKDAIEQKIEVTSEHVQELVKRHYVITVRFFGYTKAGYCGLGRIYVEHPDQKSVFDTYHPELAEYLADAMKIFGEKE